MGMRLFIIGANGRTGTELIDLALGRGHQVTAFVRSPDKITRRHPQLQVAVGDPKAADSLTAALSGHDAVFSALGIYPKEILRPTTLLQTCMVSTLEALQCANVRRLALVSAATLFPGGGLHFSLVRWVLQHQIRDLRVAEQSLVASELDWTIVRPPRLVVSPNDQYRADTGRLPDKAWSMSYRAVALFMLLSVEQRTHVREVVGLAQ